MADTKKVIDAYKQLVQEWNRKPANLEKCGTILDSLKVCITLTTNKYSDEIKI